MSRRAYFDNTARTAYLTAVASGMRLAEAASATGVSVNIAQRHARNDPAFATALKEARDIGKKLRQDAAPHDEYRYINQGCRCTACKRASAVARAGRRSEAREDDPQPAAGEGPVVVAMVAGGQTGVTFPLARAS
ncbi:hypothetical protein [Streptomyces sp. NPDC060366]|uniref:hypothetical protein n=1 Tax=Streptomyces sp. NPDC060366 TaxID=3347105 RepID=UPI00364ECBA8